MEAEEEGDDDEIVNYSDKAAFIVRRLESVAD